MAIVTIQIADLPSSNGRPMISLSLRLGPIDGEPTYAQRVAHEVTMAAKDFLEQNAEFVHNLRDPKVNS